MEEYRWIEMYTCSNVHRKAEIFQEVLLKNFHRCFPVKMTKLSSDDKPWITNNLKRLDRLRKREFFKNKKSAKWEKLNQEFLDKSEREKEHYYSNIVSDLKTSNISQWYSKVKRMHGQDTEITNIAVDELIGLSDNEQAEKIADHYVSISNLYKPLETQDFPEYSNPLDFSPPKIKIAKVAKIIRGMNKKAAAVPGDIPMKVIAECDEELSKPLTHLINICLSQGIYPNLWKMEFITPVPKVYPPEKMKDLRKILGLLNFSKITDKIIAEYIREDVKFSRDKSHSVWKSKESFNSALYD